MASVTTVAQQQKQGSLIAGIGALVGIVAFLLLPYLNFTVTVTNNIGFSNPQTNTVELPVGSGLISVLTGLIWVEAILAIAILVVAALALWRDIPFGASAGPVAMQLRRAAYTILILGAAGIVFEFLFTSIGNSQINGLLQSLSIGSISVADQLARDNESLNVTMGYAVGSWVYLIGMGVAIIGGIILLRAVGAPQTQSQQPQNWSQFSYYQQPSQPQQSWQQPPPAQPQQGWQQPPSAQPQQGWPPTVQDLPRQQQQPSQGWQPWQQPPSS